MTFWFYVSICPSLKTGFGWSSGVLLHFFSLYPDLCLSANYSGNHRRRKDLPSKEKVTAGQHLQMSRRILASHFALDTTTSSGNSSNQMETPHRPSYAWVAAPVILVPAAVVILVLCLFWCRWLFVAGETRYWRRVQNEHLQAASRGGGGGGGSGGNEDSVRDRRDSSEEFDEHIDNDQRGLFTFDV